MHVLEETINFRQGNVVTVKTGVLEEQGIIQAIDAVRCEGRVVKVYRVRHYRVVFNDKGVDAEEEDGNSKRRRCCSKANQPPKTTKTFFPVAVPADTSPGDVLKVDLETETTVRVPVPAGRSPSDVLESPLQLERDVDPGKMMLIVPKAWTKEASGLEVSQNLHNYYASRGLVTLGPPGWHPTPCDFFKDTTEQGRIYLV